MTEQAFKFRIIAQGITYLCLDYHEINICDTRALEVVRAIDSGGPIPVLPWVIFKGDIIIEPIIHHMSKTKLEHAFVEDSIPEWKRQIECYEGGKQCNTHSVYEPGERFILGMELSRAEELARRG